MPCRGNPAARARSRQDAVRGSCARSAQMPCRPVSQGMAGESAVGALLFTLEHRVQDFQGVWGRAGVRGYLYRLSGRVPQANPRHAKLAVLDGDPAGFREHRLRIALAHDGLVDVAQDGINPVELPDALRRPPLLCDVNEGRDGVQSAAKLDERRAQKDLADFAAARPDQPSPYRTRRRRFRGEIEGALPFLLSTRCNSAAV